MSAFDKFQAMGKAFAGGLAGAVISLLFTTVTDPNAVINPDAPPGADQLVQLPNTTAEWVAFGTAILVGFVLPFVKKNFPSVADAEKAFQLAQQRRAEGKQEA